MHIQSKEEDCPVGPELLTDIYRSDPAQLRQVLESIPPFTRALLAMYCRGEQQLSRVSLTIARSCTQQDLVEAGGERGAALFEETQRPSRGHLRLVSQDLI